LNVRPRDRLDDGLSRVVLVADDGAVALAGGPDGEDFRGSWVYCMTLMTS